MKLKAKKRIAKEIIILLCGFVLALIIFLFIYPYNWFYESKTKNIEKLIVLKQKQEDSLHSMDSLTILLQEYVATANNIAYKGDWSIINSKFPELKDYDKQVLKDYVATANNTKYGGDWNVINSKFPEFFAKNINYNKAIILQNEISKLQDAKIDVKWNILSSKEQKDFGLKVFFIILLILYPIRFLYILIIWSFKILKQKENY